MGVSTCLPINPRLVTKKLELLVYNSHVATAHAITECTDCKANDNVTVDYYDDPCSRDFLRTVVHGVVPFVGSCDNSTVVVDDITSKIVRSVPEVNSIDYLVIVCPASSVHVISSSLHCLYAIHIIERRDNMIVTSSRLTRASVTALQSKFTTVSCSE